MVLTYQELFPHQDFSHLDSTVQQYLSSDTPLWWVKEEGENNKGGENAPPIACLWAGNAIDQISGNRHAHIFLLYVVPEHRRWGIGKALMHHLENWAGQRGDRQIGLQVFASNAPALNLYQQLGYQTQSLWMVKPLS
ncbi:GCN5-related N-acetyltransferase [Richelia sinica FACHB-800]|uniref:GCN5-related N-acetyltransferase n=1 Tax=Richelia sinica FACHB-800 TaxID=1357546 RepID=A0A975Y3L5_9NOST|nr:GNAT family N-acetyltransferase [Richelia sinica]MBD2664979.1 GNAT family N-acetyltransferase [Richelia sinica FACHB-800]QXE22259.1 GCN5-related N-acetyltransferase [Richelia sinica FACHB-800]